MLMSSKTLKILDGMSITTDQSTESTVRSWTFTVLTLEI